ncbi:MAG: PilZ domain-containing protein [Candidatus Cloacimonetes bacterium]|nr:PilZ domain-containing protein [Candidatus Cloacimonadota bacterium]
MRKFIRHPLDIPIEYRVEKDDPHKEEFINNISEGGLSFRSKVFIKEGTEIDLRIPIRDPKLEVKALVVWCHKCKDCYDIGVKFMDISTEFRIRMVEQVCYIEHYRREVLEKEGRKLTGHQAAIEWVKKYADKFPG